MRIARSFLAAVPVTMTEVHSSRLLLASMQVWILKFGRIRIIVEVNRSMHISECVPNVEIFLNVSPQELCYR